MDKLIIGILLLLGTEVVLGMDDKELLSPIGKLPKEVGEIITRSLAREWWYCKDVCNDSFFSVNLNYDGTRLATGSNDGKARVFDVNEQKLIDRFDQSGLISTANLSHDGTRLVIASTRNEKVQIFDVNPKQLIACFDHCSGPASLSRDGMRLATVSTDYKALVFDVNTKQLIDRFDRDKFITLVSLSYDGMRLATRADSNRKVRVFDLRSRQSIFFFNHEKIIVCMNLSHDGTRLATGLDYGEVQIFDVNTEQLIACFGGNPVFCMDLNHDGTRLATGSGSGDNKARIYDVNKQQLIACFYHGSRLYSVSCNHDGSRLATASRDEGTRLFGRNNNGSLLQFCLKETLFMWTRLKKQKNSINTPELLLSDDLLLQVAETYFLKKEDIPTIWNSFPEDMKNALWRTMHYRIEKYGKEIS